MKKVIGRIAAVAATFVLILAGLMAMMRITELKDSRFKYAPFFAEKNNFDVLFVGTSHVINAVLPMELWNDRGIVSYNLGGHANTIPTTYWVTENALDYTKPKLVVIDCRGLSDNSMVYEDLSYLHISMDAFPLTKTKTAAIKDLLPADERMDFYWDFNIYHNRWNDLQARDFDNSETTEKGGESRINVAVPVRYGLLKHDEKSDPDTIGVKYLRKMITDLQKRNIQVLLVYLPFSANEKYQEEANLMGDIAEEYGINSINFLKMKDIVDYDTDSYDVDSHLNVSGAWKVTEYLGKYIDGHYNIGDKRSSGAYSGWKKDYAAYTVYKYNNLRAQTTLDDYLMLLSDKNTSCCIYVKQDSTFMKDARLLKLLENITNGIKLKYVAQCKTDGSDYLMIVDKKDGTVAEYAGYPQKGMTHTFSFGKVSYGTSDQNMRSLYIQGNKDDLILGGEREDGSDMPDVQIVAINKEDGSIQDVSRFTMDQMSGEKGTEQ
jgi:hypothetical protein